LTDSEKLSGAAREAIRNETGKCHVSAASVFELSNKVRLGKFDAAREVLARLPQLMVDNDFTPLPITLEHATMAGELTSPHRDPFDRLLAAQSILERCMLVSADPALHDLGASVLW
jgi:PIN domain nuclease of toxin-antitoxin system